MLEGSDYWELRDYTGGAPILELGCPSKLSVSLPLFIL